MNQIPEGVVESPIVCCLEQAYEIAKSFEVNPISKGYKDAVSAMLANLSLDLSNNSALHQLASLINPEISGQIISIKGDMPFAMNANRQTVATLASESALVGRVEAELAEEIEEIPALGYALEGAKKILGIEG